MPNRPKPLVLTILDGWGYSPETKNNAIALARKPTYDKLLAEFPNTLIYTSGEYVGLPDGQMGNSEVGHLNIGAGRIIYQELALINKAVREKTIDTNPVLLDTLRYCREHNKNLHFIGLVSNGGVHSHMNHLSHLCRVAHENHVSRIFIHAFTDGRDTDPKSGLDFV